MADNRTVTPCDFRALEAMFNQVCACVMFRESSRTVAKARALRNKLAGS
jgi:hypothetical protein